MNKYQQQHDNHDDNGGHVLLFTVWVSFWTVRISLDLNFTQSYSYW